MNLSFRKFESLFFDGLKSAATSDYKGLKVSDNPGIMKYRLSAPFENRDVLDEASDKPAGESKEQ